MNITIETWMSEAYENIPAYIGGRKVERVKDGFDGSVYDGVWRVLFADADEFVPVADGAYTLVEIGELPQPVQVVEAEFIDVEFEIEEADKGFMSLLNNYNWVCEDAFLLYGYGVAEEDDPEMVKQAEKELTDYGAWVDARGFWRSPNRKQPNNE